MQILFINASPHVHGHVVNLTRALVGHRRFSTVNLVNRTVKQIGQVGSSRDDFAEITRKVKRSDVIILGTPVYCLDMSGYLKTFVDRMSEILVNHWPNPFYYKELYLVVSYAVNPTAVNRIATVIETECYDMKIRYRGVISDLPQAREAKIKSPSN